MERNTDACPSTILDPMVQERHTVDELVQNIERLLHRPFSEWEKDTLHSIFSRCRYFYSIFHGASSLNVPYINPFSQVLIQLTDFISKVFFNGALNRRVCVTHFVHIYQRGWSPGLSGESCSRARMTIIYIYEEFTGGCETDFCNYLDTVFHESCHSYVDYYSNPSDIAQAGPTGHGSPWQRIAHAIEKRWKTYEMGKVIHLGQADAMAQELDLGRADAMGMEFAHLDMTLQEQKDICQNFCLDFNMAEVEKNQERLRMLPQKKLEEASLPAERFDVLPQEEPEEASRLAKRQKTDHSPNN